MSEAEMWLANTEPPPPGGTHWVQRQNLSEPGGWQYLWAPSLRTERASIAWGFEPIPGRAIAPGHHARMGWVADRRCGFQRIPATYSNLMAATVPT
jgi:hypothetical protein